MNTPKENEYTKGGRKYGPIWLSNYPNLYLPLPLSAPLSVNLQYLPAVTRVTLPPARSNTSQERVSKKSSLTYFPAVDSSATDARTSALLKLPKPASKSNTPVAVGSLTGVSVAPLVFTFNKWLPVPVALGLPPCCCCLGFSVALGFCCWGAFFSLCWAGAGAGAV